MGDHQKYFQVAGVTLQVKSDLPILENTFDAKFNLFETPGPGTDNILIHHHFEPHPEICSTSWEKRYDKSPWKIYRTDNGWVYKRIHKFKAKSVHHCTAVFNQDHTQVNIYHEPISKACYKKGNNDALTLFPTDQLLLARIFADRNSCFFHSNSVVFKNRGFLFLGHSGFGKSTLSKMLNARGTKTLCDDCSLVQKTAQGYKIHGNWCHGKENIVSNETAPLKAIFFLKQSDTNAVRASDNYHQNVYQLISYIIKPLSDKGWWENNLDLIEAVAGQIPCYTLMFDKSGHIVDLIEKL